jgi:hypothetical protein
MHLVEINAQPINGGGNAWDYDFSRATVQAAGRRAMRTLVGRWSNGHGRIDPATLVTTY